VASRCRDAAPQRHLARRHHGGGARGADGRGRPCAVDAKGGRCRDPALAPTRRVTQMANSQLHRQDEVDANLEYFLSEFPRLAQSHLGKFALLRRRKITEFFSTSTDAVRAGRALYPDGMFSIQHVTDMPIKLRSHWRA